jgi:hypothetical protein
MNPEKYICDEPVCVPSESFGSKVLRELDLAGVGIRAMPSAAVDAFTERPLETTGKLAAAAGISLAIAYTTRSPGSLRTAVQSLGVSMGVSATLDMGKRLTPVASAFVDNWDSSANKAAHEAVMRQQFAPLACDLAMAGIVGGVVGARAGRPRVIESTLPKLTEHGFLPAGIHQASWQEFATTFGTTARRKELLANMEFLLQEVKAANGTADKVYVGGSFVTNKPNPKDFDMTWKITGQRVGELQKSAPLLVDRTLQRDTLSGQLMVTYPNSPNDGVLGFLQRNARFNPYKPLPVGVVELDLKTLPSATSYKVRSLLGYAGRRKIGE